MLHVKIASGKEKTLVCSVQSATANLEKLTASACTITERPINMQIQQEKIHILFLYFFCFLQQYNLVIQNKTKITHSTFFPGRLFKNRTFLENLMLWVLVEGRLFFL